MKHDFTNAKQVLNDLTNYIKSKQNGLTTPTNEIAPLASQPKFAGDHLTEEVKLEAVSETPSIAVEVPTTNPVVENASLVDNTSVMNLPTENANYQKIVASPQTPEILNQGTPETTNMAVSAPTMTDGNIINQEFVIPQPEIAIPASTANVGQSSEVIFATDNNQVGSSMESVPEIVMPTVGLNGTNINYQASAGSAQAIINEVEPAKSDTNVVMPSGTTVEDANNQTMVVGPEAFLSR